MTIALWSGAGSVRAASHADMAEQGPAKPPLPAIDSLQLEPATLSLANLRDGRRVLVWGVAADGRKFDLTADAVFSTDSKNLTIDKENYIYPAAAGEGAVNVTAGGKQATLSVKMAGAENPKIRFVRDVEPILAQVGCNAGTCHGALHGKNGFKLSLRGYDPAFDYEVLVHDLQGRRVNRVQPEMSLMLLKPTGAVPHEGRTVIKPDSRNYGMIVQWIKEGANFDPDAAGAKAAERSIQLLLEEGLEVRIMELDGGLDPDEYCKERGADAYQERLNGAKGYFHWLADRARSQYDLRTTEGRVAVLKFLVPAVQRIPDRLERMQIAIEVAGYVGVDQANQGVVLDAFKKSVADSKEPMRQPAEVARADEKGLINVLLSDLEGRGALVAELEPIEILQRVAMRRIFQAVLAVHAAGLPLDYEAVNSRLEDADQNLLAATMMSGDAEGHDFTLEFGIQCLESLRRSDNLHRRQELKTRMKEAERTGNMPEWTRLAQELQRLERRTHPAGA